VVWLAHYDAFGRATAQGLPSSEVKAQNRSSRYSERSWIGSAHAANQADKPFEFNLRFAGQYEDRETGWHYNWHRFYDPETGRYLTPDPIGLRGGDNAFGYAAGDPFGAVDPDGLRVISRP
jgi:RHS repeat-associated protein